MKITLPTKSLQYVECLSFRLIFIFFSSSLFALQEHHVLVHYANLHLEWHLILFFFHVVGVMFQWRIWLSKRGGKPSFSISLTRGIYIEIFPKGNLHLKNSKVSRKNRKNTLHQISKKKKSKNLSSHNVEGDWRKK
jgi:hypothetical protein